MNRDEWNRIKCSICGCVDLSDTGEDFTDYDGETYCYDCEKRHSPESVTVTVGQLEQAVKTLGGSDDGQLEHMKKHLGFK